MWKSPKIQTIDGSKAVALLQWEKGVGFVDSLGKFSPE